MGRNNDYPTPGVFRSWADLLKMVGLYVLCAGGLMVVVIALKSCRNPFLISTGG